MALFRQRDKAQKNRRSDEHNAAMAGAVEVYQFWDRDINRAWNEYIKRINDLGGKPVTLSAFRKELLSGE